MNSVLDNRSTAFVAMKNARPHKNKIPSIPRVWTMGGSKKVGVGGSVRKRGENEIPFNSHDSQFTNNSKHWIEGRSPNLEFVGIQRQISDERNDSFLNENQTDFEDCSGTSSPHCRFSASAAGGSMVLRHQPTFFPPPNSNQSLMFNDRVRSTSMDCLNTSSSFFPPSDMKKTSCSPQEFNNCSHKKYSPKNKIQGQGSGQMLIDGLKKCPIPLPRYTVVTGTRDTNGHDEDVYDAHKELIMNHPAFAHLRSVTTLNNQQPTTDLVSGSNTVGRPSIQSSGGPYFHSFVCSTSSSFDDETKKDSVGGNIPVKSSVLQTTSHQSSNSPTVQVGSRLVKSKTDLSPSHVASFKKSRAVNAALLRNNRVMNQRIDGSAKQRRNNDLHSSQNQPSNQPSNTRNYGSAGYQAVSNMKNRGLIKVKGPAPPIPVSSTSSSTHKEDIIENNRATPTSSSLNMSTSNKLCCKKPEISKIKPKLIILNQSNPLPSNSNGHHSCKSTSTKNGFESEKIQNVGNTTRFKCLIDTTDSQTSRSHQKLNSNSPQKSLRNISSYSNVCLLNQCQLETTKQEAANKRPDCLLLKRSVSKSSLLRDSSNESTPKDNKSSLLLELKKSNTVLNIINNSRSLGRKPDSSVSKSSSSPSTSVEDSNPNENLENLMFSKRESKDSLLDSSCASGVSFNSSSCGGLMTSSSSGGLILEGGGGDPSREQDQEDCIGSSKLESSFGQQPFGWTESTNVETGRKIYVNTSTGERKLKPPRRIRQLSTSSSLMSQNIPKPLQDSLEDENSRSTQCRRMQVNGFDHASSSQRNILKSSNGLIGSVNDAATPKKCGNNPADIEAMNVSVSSSTSEIVDPAAESSKSGTPGSISNYVAPGTSHSSVCDITSTMYGSTLSVMDATTTISEISNSGNPEESEEEGDSSMFYSATVYCNGESSSRPDDSEGYNGGGCYSSDFDEGGEREEEDDLQGVRKKRDYKIQIPEGYVLKMEQNTNAVISKNSNTTTFYYVNTVTDEKWYQGIDSLTNRIFFHTLSNDQQRFSQLPPIYSTSSSHYSTLPHNSSATFSNKKMATLNSQQGSGTVEDIIRTSSPMMCSTAVGKFETLSSTFEKNKRRLNSASSSSNIRNNLSPLNGGGVKTKVLGGGGGLSPDAGGSGLGRVIQVGTLDIVLIRQGSLYKTKIVQNGKKLRKNWSNNHFVLTDTSLLCFKDFKTFKQSMLSAASTVCDKKFSRSPSTLSSPMKNGKKKCTVSPKACGFATCESTVSDSYESAFAAKPPEFIIDLRCTASNNQSFDNDSTGGGLHVKWSCKGMSSKSNVFELHHSNSSSSSNTSLTSDTTSLSSSSFVSGSNTTLNSSSIDMSISQQYSNSNVWKRRNVLLIRHEQSQIASEWMKAIENVIQSFAANRNSENSIFLSNCSKFDNQNISSTSSVLLPPRFTSFRGPTIHPPNTTVSDKLSTNGTNHSVSSGKDTTWVRSKSLRLKSLPLNDPIESKTYKSSLMSPIHGPVMCGGGGAREGGSVVQMSSVFSFDDVDRKTEHVIREDDVFTDDPCRMSESILSCKDVSTSPDKRVVCSTSVNRSHQNKKCTTNNSPSNNTSNETHTSNTSIKDKLKRFFLRRPTIEDLRKKGILKNEPVFGSTLLELEAHQIKMNQLQIQQQNISSTLTVSKSSSRSKQNSVKIGINGPVSLINTHSSMDYNGQASSYLENSFHSVHPFIVKCVHLIERDEVIKTDGLYRQSGSMAQIQKIRLQVDQGNLMSLEHAISFSSSVSVNTSSSPSSSSSKQCDATANSTLNNSLNGFDSATAVKCPQLDVHVLTGSLKLFFRELREPLIPWICVQKILSILKKKRGSSGVNSVIGNSNATKNANVDCITIRKALHELMPKIHYTTLHFLLKHLLKITEYHMYNRMQIANVAIVFGPTLMWPPLHNHHPHVQGGQKLKMKGGVGKGNDNKKRGGGMGKGSSSPAVCGGNGGENVAFDMMQQNVIVEMLLNNFHKIFS